MMPVQHLDVESTVYWYINQSKGHTEHYYVSAVELEVTTVHALQIILTIKWLLDWLYWILSIRKQSLLNGKYLTCFQFRSVMRREHLRWTGTSSPAQLHVLYVLEECSFVHRKLFVALRYYRDDFASGSSSVASEVVAVYPTYDHPKFFSPWTPNSTTEYVCAKLLNSTLLQ